MSIIRLPQSFRWLSLSAGRYLIASSLTACAGGPPPAASPAQSPTPAAESKPDPDAWRLQIPPTGAAVSLPYPASEGQRLPNGLEVRAIYREAPTVGVSLTCKAGALFDPKGRAGTSALTARLLLEGTKTRSAEQIAIAAEELGTHIQTDSSDDALLVQTEVLPGHVEQAIALLADVARNPAFSPKDFQRVQNEWLDRLSVQREDSGVLAQLIGRRALLGADAGENPAGNPREVAQLTVGDVARFHQASITTQHCALLAAGNIHAAELISAATHAFGNWRAPKSDSALPQRQPSWPSASRALFLPRPGAVQTTIYVASQAPGRDAEGLEARRVTDKLFGGLFTSRLNTNLREEHAFTYGAFSRLSLRNEFATWSIQSDVRADVTVAALTEVFAERKRLQDASSLSATELARAKSDLIHENAARLEHTATLLGNLEAEFSQNLPATYFPELAARVSGVERNAVAAQLPSFAPDKFVLVLVGPADALKGQNAWRGLPFETIETSWLDQ